MRKCVPNSFPRWPRFEIAPGAPVLAYLHDPADPTDRSVRELAFPSVVIFASEAELRTDCMKELRAKYPIGI
jgi:hypothetical protein